MRRVGLLLVAVLGFTLTPIEPGGTTPVANAASNEVVAVVVEGTGYGHGRGMSQWGAYGWAVDQNKSWQWILDHYYGGTTLGSVNTAQGRIKVRPLGFDGATTIGVTTGSGSVSAGGVTGRSLKVEETTRNRFKISTATTMACPGNTSLTVPDGTIQRNSKNGTAVRQIQVFLNAFQAGTELAVDGDFGPATERRLKEWQASRAISIDGIWNTSPDAATARAQINAAAGAASWSYERTVTGPLTFSTGAGENSSTLAANVLGICDAGGKITHYRGKIELHDGSGGTNVVVNDVKTEDYLRGVVPKEISASWANAGGGKGANAVRAQAVAARSYALAYNSSRWAPAQICDSQSCQVYFGSATRSTASSSATSIEDSRTDAAIAATAGKVRLNGGNVVSTEFSASNGPRTAGNTFPPVDDAHGDATAKNPNHKWTRVLPATQIAADYGLGTLTSATMVDGDSRYDGIWWNNVRLVGTSRTVTVSAWDFMSKYRYAFGGLKSPGFTVRTVTRDTTNKTFAMIGDSVGNSVAGSFSSEFVTMTKGMFASSTIDVRDGRCIAYRCKNGSALSNGVEVAADLPRNLDLVVVELGYNQVTPAGMAADIDAMMQALDARGVKQVVWVNLATAPGASYYSAEYARRNAALDAARARWSNLTILDWASASTTPEWTRWFSDHAHLAFTGQAQFAVWLREQLQVLAPPAPPPQRLAPPKRLEIPVVGRSVKSPSGGQLTVPATASAVTLNVTSVKPTTEGYLTVWPCGMARPLASSVNYVAGATMGNGVIAPIGANGSVCLYSYANTDAVVDINGWFDSAASGSQFVAATPDRLVDTRYGVGAPQRRVDPSSPLSIAVTGRTLKNAAGSTVTIPADADAVAINITSVKPIGEGYVTVWPCGGDRPVVSSLNYEAGTVIANGAVVAVGSGGKICLHSYAPTDVVVDVVGWFGSATAAPTFVSANPERVVDTRYGLGAPKRRVAPNRDLSIPIANRQLTVGGQKVSVPSDAKAVAMNVTAVGSATSGYATVWPCGTARPYTSSLNYDRGITTAGNVIAPIGSNGSVCLHTYVDAHYVVDVFGWFTAADEFVSAVPDRIVDTRFGIGPRPV